METKNAYELNEKMSCMKRLVGKKLKNVLGDRSMFRQKDKMIFPTRKEVKLQLMQ